MTNLLDGIRVIDWTQAHHGAATDYMLDDLAAGSDVLITNHRAGVRQRLGLAYQDLSPDNPRLIYRVASGYGEEGPFCDERSFDNVAFAWSGMMHLIGEEDGPPQYMTPGAADQSGATMLTQGIISGLYWRERTGEGQQVEASLLGALVNLLALPFDMFLMSGRLPKRPTRTNLRFLD